MYTLLLLFALQVVLPREMVCLGFVQDSFVPQDIYVAAVQNEGLSAMASEGQVLYLNGPKVASLRSGEVHRVIRPEGKIHDPSTGDGLGIYYRELGTVRVEAVGKDNATALVLVSCHAILKGDLVVPVPPKTAVEFNGSLSSSLTPIPAQGLVSSIVLGKDDVQEIAAGSFCFIGLGARDGVKPGDRFTVIRPHASFHSRDLTVDGKGANASYSPLRNDWNYRHRLNAMLRNRAVPPRVLGDFVVVQTGERVSAGKIVNSLSEIHLGDLVVKR
jgi:hypothetical protein